MTGYVSSSLGQFANSNFIWRTRKPSTSAVGGLTLTWSLDSVNAWHLGSMGWQLLGGTEVFNFRPRRGPPKDFASLSFNWFKADSVIVSGWKTLAGMNGARWTVFKLYQTSFTNIMTSMLITADTAFVFNLITFLYWILFQKYTLKAFSRYVATESSNDGSTKRR